MASRRKNFDVVIAGGGLVGGSLACALSGQGLKIAVVEPHPPRASDQSQPPSYDDRKIALALASMHIFDAIGVWRILREGVTPIEHVHVSERGRFGTVRMHASDHGVAALGYCVEARIIGQAVMQRLDQCEDVELIAPAQVTGVDCGPQNGEMAGNSARNSASREHARVTITSDGRERVLKARVLVGADGAASAVRDALDIQASEHDYQQVAVVTNVTPEQPHGGWAYERLTPNGPLAVLPLSGQRCGVVYTVKAGTQDAILELGDEAFLARLQQRFGYRLGRFVKVGRRVSYPLKLIQAETMVANRAVLIGNAAHTIHPISAQGFNLGLRDAAALAQYVVDASRNGDDIGSPQVLGAYQCARDPDQQRTIQYTDQLVRAFGRRLLPLALARNAAMIALDMLPPLKKRLARQTMGYAGEVPRLARGLPL